MQNVGGKQTVLWRCGSSQFIRIKGRKKKIQDIAISAMAVPVNWMERAVIRGGWMGLLSVTCIYCVRKVKL